MASCADAAAAYPCRVRVGCAGRRRRDARGRRRRTASGCRRPDQRSPLEDPLVGGHGQRMVGPGAEITQMNRSILIGQIDQGSRCPVRGDQSGRRAVGVIGNRPEGSTWSRRTHDSSVCAVPIPNFVATDNSDGAVTDRDMYRDLRFASSRGQVPGQSWPVGAVRYDPPCCRRTRMNAGVHNRDGFTGASVS